MPESALEHHDLPLDPVDLVRCGYNAVSTRYRGDYDIAEPVYAEWTSALVAAAPNGARVLDVGCGNGVPIARDLTAAGFQVTGVDLSETQIARARTLVPRARFLCADILRTDWPPESFDAVIALYSIIHVPVDEQRALVERLARWTAPGGLLLLVAGADAWTGMQEDWLGGGAPMYWSQADAATYRRWLTDVGWRVTDERWVPDGDSGHQVFWAHRA